MCLEDKGGKGASYEAPFFLLQLQDIFMPHATFPVFALSLHEEKMKNVRTLVQESSSMPHVMIQFDRIQKEKVLFSVLVVNPSPLPFLEKQMEIVDPLITFLPEKVRTYSSLETHMFSIALPIHPFLRREKLHLPRARKRVTKALQNILGEFRDYNGGFWEKREQLLQELQMQFLGNPFVEELFYSLFPADAQVLLKPSLLKRFFKLCLAHLFKEGEQICKKEAFTFVHKVGTSSDFIFRVQKKCYNKDLIYTFLEKEDKDHVFLLAKRPNSLAQLLVL